MKSHPHLIITERLIIMKTKIASLVIIILLVITTILFLTFPEDVMSSVSFSISIWKDTLIPSLFPFFLISELLIHYGFIELLGEGLRGFMNKVFHLPGEASFVLIGSLISGFPSSSKYINGLLEDNKITLEEASYLLKFNHFSNPLFVIGTVGTLMLNNKSIGILILIVHILSNFIVAMIYRPKYNTYQNSKSSLITGISSMHKKRIESSMTFVSFLTESIFKIFQTLLLLLGIITSFLIITTLLKRVLNLDSMTFSLLSGLLEMTQGIKNISLLDISLNIKASIITFFISFGGFSIHMQVMSILSNYKIKYFPYLLARVIHASIASSIIFIILTFIN